MFKRLFLMLSLTAMAAGAHAGTVDQSLRPEARPGSAQTVTQAANVVLALGPSIRPKARPTALQATPRAVEPTPVRDSAKQTGLERWVTGFRTRAVRQGISTRTFDAAFRNVRYDPEVVRRDRNQSEFTKTIGEYLETAASPKRVSNGNQALRRHGRLLQQIEDRFGVEKEVVAAVWGMESAYGEHRGDMPLIGSLATLSYDGRRGSFFEKQLIAALKILQNGDISPSKMTGSWAGAMGHTQFIPTSYLAYAVDFTGDGKRDIWSDNPADALASTAAYLARHGWVKGMPWGVEVKLPRGFDYGLAGAKKMPSDWAKFGVVGADGRPVPNYGSATLMLPAGARGPALLVFKNFTVISRYNNADAYIIGVGHLSDRLKGKPGFRADWPKGDRLLTFAERKELQQRLTSKGFNTRGVDGRIGPATMAAVKGYQRSVGMEPDGYVSFDLLRRLR